MTLTDGQTQLLKSLVGAHTSGHTSAFLVVRTHDGTTLTYGDGFNLPVTSDLFDFRRLKAKGFIDFDEAGRNPSGKLTAEGLRSITASSEPPVTPSNAAHGPTPHYKYDLFICHASEDKASFVARLAEGLRQVGLSVWYDDFALEVGDGLREAIDEGLVKSEFGVVVLSPHFFEKDWPMRELEGLTALERDGRKVILPIWHEINEAEVRRHSPTLAGMMAAQSSAGISEVIIGLQKAMTTERKRGSEQPRRVATLAVPGRLAETDPVRLVKARLSAPLPRIDLHDLVMGDTRTLCKTLSEERFGVDSTPVAKEPFLERLAEYERATQPLMKMLATIGYHGTPEESRLIVDVVTRLGAQRSYEGATGWMQLQLYPALLVEYATGVAAVARGNYPLLAAALLDTLVPLESRHEKVLAVRALNYSTIFMGVEPLHEWLPIHGKRLTPASDYLSGVIGPTLPDELSGGPGFLDAFDTFEFVVGISAMFADGGDWAPFGSFAWRHRRQFDESPPARFFTQGLKAGDDWGLLKAGFFDGSATECARALEKYRVLLHSSPAFRG